MRSSIPQRPKSPNNNKKAKNSPRFGPISPKRQRSNPITHPTFEASPATVNRMYEQGTPLGFTLVVVDLQKRVSDAVFHSFPVAAQPGEIEVRQGKIEEMNDGDCVVISSNGFGLMNHGFDRSVAKMLGDGVKERVVQGILENFHGEQPVGTCLLVPTGHSTIRYIAHAPTRRINFSIRATDYVYLAVKAVIQCIRMHNRQNPDDIIERVIMTGLGTFYGAVPAEESARQMCLAWLLARMPPKLVSEVTWDYARERSEMIGYGSFIHVLNEMIHRDDVQMAPAQRRALVSKLSKVAGKTGQSSPRMMGMSGSMSSPRKKSEDASEFSALPPAHQTDDIRDTVKVGSERENKTTLQLPGRFKTRPGADKDCVVM